MADNEDGSAGVGPACRRQSTAGTDAPGTRSANDAKLALQRLRGLLRAVGGTDENRASWPGRWRSSHPAMRSACWMPLAVKPAAEVRLARFGFRMPPEDQVHVRPCDVRVGRCRSARPSARAAPAARTNGSRPALTAAVRSSPSAASSQASLVVGQIRLRGPRLITRALSAGSSTGNATSIRRKRLRPIQSALAQPHRLRAVVAKIPDAAVLEKAADDRAHADVLGDARHAGRSAHAPRTIRSISHAGLRRRVERRDHAFLEQRVHLGDDARRLAVARVLRLAPDRVEQPRVHRERREPQALAACVALREARDVQEHFVDVGADVARRAVSSPKSV